MLTYTFAVEVRQPWWFGLGCQVLGLAQSMALVTEEQAYAAAFGAFQRHTRWRIVDGGKPGQWRRFDTLERA